jgi:hypothetical protein
MRAPATGEFRAAASRARSQMDIGGLSPLGPVRPRAFGAGGTDQREHPICRLLYQLARVWGWVLSKVVPVIRPVGDIVPLYWPIMLG